MNSQEQFDSFPGVKVNIEAIVYNWLRGKRVIVNHPWPEFGREGAMQFIVTEVRIEQENDVNTALGLTHGRIFVRGENTMWFGQNTFKVDVGM